MLTDWLSGCRPRGVPEHCPLQVEAPHFTAPSFSAPSFDAPSPDVAQPPNPPNPPPPPDAAGPPPPPPGNWKQDADGRSKNPHVDIIVEPFLAHFPSALYHPTRRCVVCSAWCSCLLGTACRLGACNPIMPHALRYIEKYITADVVQYWYGTFRLNFHRLDRFELDLRGHTQP